MLTINLSCLEVRRMRSIVERPSSIKSLSILGASGKTSSGNLSSLIVFAAKHICLLHHSYLRADMQSEAFSVTCQWKSTASKEFKGRGTEI